jgi:phage gp45-like
MDRREKNEINNKIRNSAASKVVLQSTNDGHKMQTMQATGLDGEVWDDLEYYQPYGITARAKPGSEGIVLPIGGDRGHGVVISTDDRNSRKKDLAVGEVALYSENGDYLHLKNGNKVELLTKDFLVTGDMVIEGNLTVNGNITVTGDVKAGGISLRNHTHGGDSGGSTSGPR